MKAKLVKESLSFKQLNRNNRQKIDPNNVDVIYHWLTEGKFFYACYGDVSNDDKFVLDRKNIMPPKPSTKYELGYREVCLTVDPTYTEPAFNEDGICLVLDMKKLLKDYELIDLSDNGEAEFRTKVSIQNWPKYCLRIEILKDSYENGLYFEEYKFRAIKRWIPDELKNKVLLYSDMDEIVDIHIHSDNWELKELN